MADEYIGQYEEFYLRGGIRHRDYAGKTGSDKRSG